MSALPDDDATPEFRASNSTGVDASILAIGPTPWEHVLLGALRHPAIRLPIVRRCLDAIELLAAIETSTASFVIVSADLPRLDLDVVARLRTAGVMPIGIVTAGERQERAMRQLGIEQVVNLDVQRPASGASGIASVVRLHSTAVPEEPVLPAIATPSEPSGQVIAVWGAPGSVGKTTIALTIADEIAATGRSVILIDADVDAPGIASALALVEPPSGVAVAMRRATAGRLDAEALEAQCVAINPALLILPGAARAGHRSDLRAPAFAEVRRVAAVIADVVVIDCGSVPLPIDGVGEQASLAVLDTLTDADSVLLVGGSDPVSLQRLLHAADSLVEAQIASRIVLNRVSDREAPAVIHRALPAHEVLAVPHDAEVTSCLADGMTLRERAPRSKARKAICALVPDRTEQPQGRRGELPRALRSRSA